MGLGREGGSGQSSMGPVFAGAATTKHRRLGGLNNRSSFSHSFRGQKSEIRISAGSVSPAVSPWLADGSLLTVLTESSLCVACVLSPSFCKDTTHSGLGPILVIPLYLIAFLKVLSPNVVAFGGARS